jgi:hypothetical protein
VSDWQPAILINAHNGEDTEADKKMARVREIDLTTQPYRYRKFGCKKLYAIHPDDEFRLVGQRTNRMCVCEHEILTD